MTSLVSCAPPYPVIHPVNPDKHRPFWSVMIPTYNCNVYLEKTLKSVLAQDPGPEIMQIEVIDDFSPDDDPQTVVNDLGHGRVHYYRQPKNVGAPSNFTTCVRRATGRWVHILHGDDEVLPGFYQHYRNIIETQKCSMVVGRSILIDENNFWRSITRALQYQEGLLDKAHFALAKANEVRTPAVVVSRAAYEHVGGYLNNLIHCADWEMWSRLAAYDPVGYIPRPLTLYREHSASDTTRVALSGLDTKDAIQALEIIASRFQNSLEKEKIQSIGNMWIGVDCLYKTLHLVLKGNITPALKHLTHSLRFTPSIIKNWRELLQKFF